MECIKFRHPKAVGAEARAHKVGSTRAWEFREAKKGQNPNPNPRTTVVIIIKEKYSIISVSSTSRGVYTS